ncbi:unnamed protein product [Adineta steineri]|uniref:Uncharacterized protein n=1 Tax=Adineta steineri TaxID=433720 RepID=A0A814QXZ8_9BILA|nr:unnamed protein product [Adineta steineri]CAF1125296.1 unnamed protein product [Adineta steineri]
MKNIQFDSNKKKDSKLIEVRRYNDEEASSSSSFITNRKRRSERFCLPPKMISNNKSSNTSVNVADWNGSKFVFEWHMRFVFLLLINLFEILYFVSSLKMKKIGQEHGAHWIIDYYIPITKQSDEKIFQACVRLYTAESFVYHLINTALRDNDSTKVDTLGAFCYLLFQFNFEQEFNDLKFSDRVYRGADLTSSILAEYERNIGNVCAWLGLTSTSRQRKIAESFFDSTVLLRSGTHFIINKVEQNSSSTNNIKTLIYLTIE